MQRQKLALTINLNTRQNARPRRANTLLVAADEVIE
jgi:hypothetical protein